MPPDDDSRLVALYDAHGPSVWRYVVHLTGDRGRRRRHRAGDPAARLAESADPRAGSGVDPVVDVHGRPQPRDRRGAQRPSPPRDRRRRDARAGRATTRTDALFESLLVEEALATLELEHRAVIVHAYYGGCSVAEVARRLGIPEGTVKSRLHYGLRALRLALQEKGVTR